MRPIDPKKLHDSEELARTIGRVIGEACRRQMGEKWGFALLLFSFDGPELTWISNAERASMIEALKELIGRLEAGGGDELSRPKGRG